MKNIFLHYYINNILYYYFSVNFFCTDYFKSLRGRTKYVTFRNESLKKF